MSITLPKLPMILARVSKEEHTTLEQQFRARDIEVALLVLEGAKGALVQASIEAKRGTDRAVLTAAAIIVRALEVRHHE